MHDLLTDLLKANLAASVAMVVVLTARRPLRALFGARVAYGLWVLPALAAMASLLPPRTAGLLPAAPVTPEALITAAEQTMLAVLVSGAPALEGGAPLGLASFITTVWITGLVGMACRMALKQREFMNELAEGDAGPAVVGVIAPRIVTPADFEARFDASEQAVVLAHEEAHLIRQDARVNAFAALLRCVCWFNPLVHVAAYLMRIDQELACDATVIEQHPRARVAYAQALLKAQLAARPLPLGCYWQARAEHPLMERMEMLERPMPSPVRRLAGGALIIGLSAGAAYAAWASAPAAAAPLAYVEDALALAAAPRAPVAAAPARSARSSAQKRSPAAQAPPAPPAPRTLISVAGPFKSTEVDFGRTVRIQGRADEKIADVRMASPTAARIEGVWYGRTEARFVDADGKLLMIADIQVGEAEPIAYVGAGPVPFGQPWEKYFDPNKRIVVTGRVLEARIRDDARSELILEQNTGGRQARFRVSMPHPVNLTPDYQSGLRMLPGSAVQVRGYEAHDQTCEGGGCLMVGTMILSPPPEAGEAPRSPSSAAPGVH